MYYIIQIPMANPESPFSQTIITSPPHPLDKTSTSLLQGLLMADGGLQVTFFFFAFNLGASLDSLIHYFSFEVPF